MVADVLILIATVLVGVVVCVGIGYAIGWSRAQKEIVKERLYRALEDRGEE